MLSTRSTLMGALVGRQLDVRPPVGVGESWIACALAQSACRNGHGAPYVRVSRLLSALAIARAEGTGTHDFVPRRFAPTDDRFASEG